MEKKKIIIRAYDTFHSPVYHDTIDADRHPYSYAHLISDLLSDPDIASVELFATK